jgi:hypothetical protein
LEVVHQQQQVNVMADSAGAAAEAVAVQSEFTDTDGTVMEWDADRKAYFPKVCHGSFVSLMNG